VIATLGAVCHREPSLLPKHPSLDAFFEGDRLLKQNTEEVFGAAPANRHVRIMVTLPAEAAGDYTFVRELVRGGTDCIRINRAHDSPDEWRAMIDHLRRVEVETGRACKVYMDLGGPKFRLEEVLPSLGSERVREGDRLLLCFRKLEVPTDYSQAGRTRPDVLERIPAGASVSLDDGRIGARVESIGPDGLELRIERARSKGEKLKADQGINFPDTELTLDPLTDKDRRDLDFVAVHADIIGYSFVQTATDIETLQMELQSRLGKGWLKKALVAKVETPLVVRNLPEPILHGAGKQPFGVMIARGDLAVRRSNHRARRFLLVGKSIRENACLRFPRIRRVRTAIPFASVPDARDGESVGATPSSGTIGYLPVGARRRNPRSRIPSRTDRSELPLTALSPDRSFSLGISRLSERNGKIPRSKNRHFPR
jgi:pyruvate kinase